MSVRSASRVSGRAAACLVFAACAAPRAAALLWFPPDTTLHYYWDTSDVFFGRRPLALPDADAAFLEPLYPALLAALRWLCGDRTALVMLMQAFLGAAAGVLLFRLTERMTGSRTAASIAAVLYAFDPYLVRQSVGPVEITLATALLIAAATQFDRSDAPRRAAAAGVLLGLAGLTRFSFLPIAAGAALLLAYTRRATQAVLLAGAAALTLAPWIATTYASSGALVPTRVGVNLFVSTNEYADRVVPTRNADLLVPYAYEVAGRLVPAGVPPDERLRREDDVLLALALQFARERPSKTIALKLRNLAYSLAPLLLPVERRPPDAIARIDNGVVSVTGLSPRPLHERVLYSVSRTMLIAGACIGLFVRRQWRLGDGFMVLTAATIVGVQTVFFPTSRLGAPMAWVLMFYAAVALGTDITRAHGNTRRHDDTTTRRTQTSNL